MDVELVDALRSVLLGVLSLAGVALGYLARWLAKKSRHDLLDALILKLRDAATLAVDVTGQTYVDELKDRNRDGKIDSSEAKHAFRLAMDSAKRRLGAKIWGEAVSAFGGEQMATGELAKEIEAAVARKKLLDPR